MLLLISQSAFQISVRISMLINERPTTFLEFPQGLTWKLVGLSFFGIGILTLIWKAGNESNTRLKHQVIYVRVISILNCRSEVKIYDEIKVTSSKFFNIETNLIFSFLLLINFNPLQRVHIASAYRSSSFSSSSLRALGAVDGPWFSGDHVELLFAPFGLLGVPKWGPSISTFFILNPKIGWCIYMFNYACPIFKFNFNIIILKTI